MFLQSSRYFNLKIVAVETEDGRTVAAVTLRRLPYVAGTPTVIKGRVLATRNWMWRARNTRPACDG